MTSPADSLPLNRGGDGNFTHSPDDGNPCVSPHQYPDNHDYGPYGWICQNYLPVFVRESKMPGSLRLVTILEDSR